jgi:hypothetical protein
MDRFTAIAKVRYYDPNFNPIKENIAITNVSTLAEAAEQIEDWYGDDLIGCAIELIGDRFLILSDDEVNAQLEKEYSNP